MTTAICSNCIEDSHFRDSLAEHFEHLECSVCGEESDEAVTVESLAAVLEPVLREYFVQGAEEKHYSGDDDKGWWEQSGEPLNDIIQTVTGQYFDFEDELVDAVCDLDDAWPGDGEEPLWEATANYVPRRLLPYQFTEHWNAAVEDLKRNRRFFSVSVRDLFDSLFANVGQLFATHRNGNLPVTVLLPVKTILFRARVCSSITQMGKMADAPLELIGPPPSELAKSGRMNPEGVVVLYAAFEEDTARAELRPAIGNDLAVIKLVTTQPLKVLDLERLERVTAATNLSYFQPDYEEQVTKHTFLRRLHGLISQPVVPGRESDYLITQTMAEYLAHVHAEKFDGVKFASAQSAGGMNVVLFSRHGGDIGSTRERFNVDYLPESISFSRVTQVHYSHTSVKFVVRDDGQSFAYLPDLQHHEDEDDYA
ncbi:RES domain-containing protein [Paraburkholderia phenoliruptrix]|uniref:RES domain-containing protein n=1 Tax=Paraburkholderia phenoliruptrix TaxID=252970 RepID=UPI0039B66D05